MKGFYPLTPIVKCLVYILAYNSYVLKFSPNSYLFYLRYFLRVHFGGFK